MTESKSMIKISQTTFFPSLPHPCSNTQNLSILCHTLILLEFGEYIIISGQLCHSILIAMTENFLLRSLQTVPTSPFSLFFLKFHWSRRMCCRGQEVRRKSSSQWHDRIQVKEKDVKNSLHFKWQGIMNLVWWDVIFWLSTPNQIIAASCFETRPISI